MILFDLKTKESHNFKICIRLREIFIDVARTFSPILYKVKGEFLYRVRNFLCNDGILDHEIT